MRRDEKVSQPDIHTHTHAPVPPPLRADALLLSPIGPRRGRDVTVALRSMRAGALDIGAIGRISLFAIGAHVTTSLRQRSPLEARFSLSLSLARCSTSLVLFLFLTHFYL